MPHGARSALLWVWAQWYECRVSCWDAQYPTFQLDGGPLYLMCFVTHDSGLQTHDKLHTRAVKPLNGNSACPDELAPVTTSTVSNASASVSMASRPDSAANCVASALSSISLRKAPTRLDSRKPASSRPRYARCSATTCVGRRSGDKHAAVVNASMMFRASLTDRTALWTLPVTKQCQ